MTICCKSASLKKKLPILKDIFIFLANNHHFQKSLFLVEILTFLKEVSPVFEMSQILVVCIPLVENVMLCKKCF